MSSSHELTSGQGSSRSGSPCLQCGTVRLLCAAQISARFAPIRNLLFLSSLTKGRVAYFA